MASYRAKGLYRLVTVNTTPARAKRVVGRVIEELKDRYTIEHVANCEREDQVESTVRELKPDVLFCASMWTADESSRILATAQSVLPGIKTYAIPYNLHLEKGPEGVVDHLKERLPTLLG